MFRIETEFKGFIAASTRKMAIQKLSRQTVRKWGLIATALALPVYFLLRHFGNSGEARAGAIAFGILILVVRGSWHLRSHVWYWLTIAAVVLVHVLIIASIRWTNRSIPGPVLAPFGVADLLIIGQIVRLSAWLAGSSDQTGNVERPERETTADPSSLRSSG